MKYNGASEFVTRYRVRTVFRFFTTTVTVPFIILTVRSVKQTETFNFDRWLLSIWPWTVPHQNGDRYPLIFEDREPHQNR